MPSDTFFRLPEEKREKLIAAAREEFAHTPYEAVSINRIIRQAKIPRGSFYMYFEGKEALFRYVLTLYIEQISETVVAELEHRKGDIFSVAVSFYDKARNHRFEGGNKALYQQLLETIRINAKLRPEQIFPECRGALERMIAAVDASNLNVQGEDDLFCMLYLLVPVTIGAICSDRPEFDRERFLNLLSILRRGLEKEKQPAGTAHS